MYILHVTETRWFYAMDQQSRKYKRKVKNSIGCFFAWTLINHFVFTCNEDENDEETEQRRQEMAAL
jgi:hypothetical protein